MTPETNPEAPVLPPDEPQPPTDAAQKQIDAASAGTDHPPVMSTDAPGDASAADKADAPAEADAADEAPHPAIAAIQGAGVHAGTVVDITNAVQSELPVSVVVIDEQSRAWKVRETEEGEGGYRRELVCVGAIRG